MAQYKIRTFNAPAVHEPNVGIEYKIGLDDWVPGATDGNGVFEHNTGEADPQIWGARFRDPDWEDDEIVPDWTDPKDFIVVPV